MENTLLKDQLNAFLTHVDTISEKKQYWLIRTEGGDLFDTYRAHNFVSIGYEEISYKKILDYKKSSGNFDDLKDKLKLYIEKVYPDKQPGLVAGQLIRFIYDVKKGDVVIIPSENSNFVSIGIFQETPLMEVDNSMLDRTKCNYTKRKSVKWLKTFSRSNLDPYLYKVLQSHQAINDISKYASIIERSLGDFYKLEDNTNLIVNVQKKTSIKANDLLFFGSDLLRLAESFISDNDLELDISDVEIKININSEGRAQFLSKNGKIILILGLIIIGINGGGLKANFKGFNFDLSTDGLIQKVSDYIDNYHDRKMVDELMKNKDSLEIKNPDDLIKVIKQFSKNKDISK
ncbi:hypothetical protein [Flavobacterium bizetiae]|uniref:hypothetical protein n=1 Tax=Flavobacterium bizetiae TaxID=2704140 RepID=UPI003757EAC9